MAETYYADFRDYIDCLEKRGKLHRWRRPVNKDTEMMPLMRLQYRGIADEERKVFLFENVYDSRLWRSTKSGAARWRSPSIHAW